MASYRYFRHALLAAAVLVPLVGAAQTTRRDPLDPQAAVADAPYQSAFSEYQKYQDPEVGSWRSANESVGQAAGEGGHNMGDMKGTGGQQKMDGMPGHSMSDMKTDSKPGNAKARPEPRVTGKAETGGVPAHDMSKMKEKAATPGKKSQPGAGKPAEAAPKAMQDHSGMKKQ